MGLLLGPILQVALNIIFKKLTTVPGFQYIYLFNLKKTTTNTQYVPRNILDIVITSLNKYKKFPASSAGSQMKTIKS